MQILSYAYRMEIIQIYVFENDISNDGMNKGLCALQNRNRLAHQAVRKIAALNPEML